MLELSILEKFDSMKMHSVYDKWPEITKKSFESDQDSVNFDGVKHIVFAGMGGSGTIGDIFSTILSKTNIHVTIVKGYLLPKTVNSDTLVVITSVSGNTKEALSVLEAAKNMKCKIVAFSSGGDMKEFCSKNNIEHRTILEHHSPRGSLTSFLYTILKVLHSTLKIEKNDILDSIKELEIIGEKINSSNLTESNPALELANWITGIPIIYYPFGLQSAAIRFKNSLQENAKMHIFTEDIIEVCHNGVVAWEKDSIVQPIILQGENDHFKTKEKYSVLEEYFKKNNINYYKIYSIKGNILSKLMSLIYLLDYATIYRAVLSEIDPTPTNSIDFIKNRLEEISK